MKKLIYVAMAMVMITACNKYENGPDFSLKSKKERLSNNWLLMSAVDLNGDGGMAFASIYSGYQLNIGGDEQYTITYSPNGIGSYMEIGRWDFNEDKTHVILTSVSGKICDFLILRLDKNALWVRFTDEDHEWEVHLFPKS